MSAVTTRKLLAAARQMFREVGYAATSMDELCATVGLTRGALYHHFGGKPGLLEAVVVEIFDEMGQRLVRDFAEEPDPWRGLVAGCQRYLHLAIEPDLQRIVFQEAPAVLGQRLRDIDARFVAPLQDVLEGLMNDGRLRKAPVDPLARILMGAMMELALWVATQPDGPRALSCALASLDVVLNGLTTDLDRAASEHS
ncbi:MAG: TetR/AcrR family transcriptional regulator [Myxococcota bacterium]